jgi:long-subunit fatty acid transport protein
VPDFRLEPGVPQGDAWIYAIGASFDFARVSFDLGYSFHDHRSRQENAWTRYSSSAKVFAVSARYRF